MIDLSDELGAAGVRVVVSHRSDGHMGVRGAEPRETILSRRQRLSRAVACGEMLPTGVLQVHGARVLHVPEEHDGASPAPEADGLVTTRRGRPLLVLGADCPMVAMASDDGAALAVVHAGWRGVVAGVHATAVESLRERSQRPLRAIVGPHIGPCCYEVGPEVIEALRERWGESNPPWSRSGDGDRSFLDLGAVLTESLARLEVQSVRSTGGCTRCTAGAWFSHRGGDEGRHALVAALVP